MSRQVDNCLNTRDQIKAKFTKRVSEHVFLPIYQECVGVWTFSLQNLTFSLKFMPVEYPKFINFERGIFDFSPPFVQLHSTFIYYLILYRLYTAQYSGNFSHLYEWLAIAFCMRQRVCSLYSFTLEIWWGPGMAQHQHFTPPARSGLRFWMNGWVVSVGCCTLHG